MESGRRPLAQTQAFPIFAALIPGFSTQFSNPRNQARRRKEPGQLPGPSWSWNNSDGTRQGNATWQLSDRGKLEEHVPRERAVSLHTPHVHGLQTWSSSLQQGQLLHCSGLSPSARFAWAPLSTRAPELKE